MHIFVLHYAREHFDFARDCTNRGRCTYKGYVGARDKAGHKTTDNLGRW